MLLYRCGRGGEGVSGGGWSSARMGADARLLVVLAAVVPPSKSCLVIELCPRSTRTAGCEPFVVDEVRCNLLPLLLRLLAYPSA